MSTFLKKILGYSSLWRAAGGLLWMVLRYSFMATVVVPAIVAFLVAMSMSDFSFARLAEGYYASAALTSPASKPGYLKVHECDVNKDAVKTPGAFKKQTTQPEFFCKGYIEKDVPIQTLAKEAGDSIGTMYWFFVKGVALLLFGSFLWVFLQRSWRFWREMHLEKAGA